MKSECLEKVHKIIVKKVHMKSIHPLLLNLFFGLMTITVSCSNTKKPAVTSETNQGALHGKKVLYVYGGWNGHEAE